MGATRLVRSATRSGLRRQDERGFMIVAVMFLILMVFGLSLGFLQQGMAERASVIHHESSTIALEVAEMGLARSEMEFCSQVDSAADGIGNVLGEYLDDDLEVATFEVTAVPGSVSSIWILRAMGSHGLSVRRLEVGLKVTLPYTFTHAIYAKRPIRLDSSMQTDSFDSRLGPYLLQATNVDALGPYAQPTGHIGSEQRIDLFSSVIVRGDARPGPGYVTTLNGGSARVTGSRAPVTTVPDVPIPPEEDFADALANNDNAADVWTRSGVSYNTSTRALFVDGSVTVTLSGGTYFFSDFVFDGSSRLVVTAPSKIYVTRRLEINSSVRVNNPGIATDLSFIAHPYALTPGYTATTNPIRLDSSLQAAFTLYAPGRDVVVNSSIELFGAIVGRAVNVNSSAKIHFDRALLDANDGAPAITERLWWRDAAPPNR